VLLEAELPGRPERDFHHHQSEERGEQREAGQDLPGGEIDLARRRHACARRIELRREHRGYHRERETRGAAPGEEPVEGCLGAHSPWARAWRRSRASFTLSAARWISCQVVSSTGMPSLLRLARISRSGSPAMRTWSKPGAGRDLRSQSRNSRASRSKAAAVPRRFGSITITSMPFITRCLLDSS